MSLSGHLGTLFVDIVARNRMKGEIGRIGNQMRAAGRIMTKYVTLPIVAAGAMSVKTAAEFETSMRQIAVATGAPNRELKKMEKLAIKLGADTIYSANEAAEAMLELAKSGINPAQIQAGALASTLALAAASGLDMATSAVVMGTSLNAFHLEAKDAKAAVDALAGAANASSAEVKDIALALQQVSAMAYQSGLSIQETTAVLAAFADSGIRGSDAGTSFKVFLQRLNPVSGKAKELMDELNMSFYKSNGKMKPLVGIVKELQAKLSGMTQKQRMANMQILFGTDAIRAAAVLYDQGAKGMKEYIKETTAAGSASKMAAARMGGIAGALEQLRGSIETAGLIIGKLLAPAVRMVSGALKKMLNAFSSLPKPTQKMIILIAALVAVIGPLLMILGLMASGVTVLMSGALAPFLVILLQVSLAIGAIVLVGYLLIKMWKYLYPVVKPLISAFGELWKALKSLWSLIKPLLLPVLKVLATLVGGVLLVAFSQLAMVLAVIVNVIAGVIKIFVGLGKVIFGVGEILWGFITGNRKLMAKGVKDMTAGFGLMGEGAKNAVVDSARAVYDIMKSTVGSIGSMLEESMGKAADQADKTGKETGKKYSEGHAEETEKGRKKEKKEEDKAFEKKKEQARLHGEQTGTAYNEGLVGGLYATRFSGPVTKDQKADQEEMEGYLDRRKAYWKAYIELDFDAAKKLMDSAKRHDKKAAELRGESDKKAIRGVKVHNKKRKGLAQIANRNLNTLLKNSLNTQSGIFLLSRKNRLALLKSFQVRERFATKNHNGTMATIFRFFKNKVADLDRMFNTQSGNRRRNKNLKERRINKWHWNQIIFAVGIALFGPAGLLNLHLLYGQRVLTWLRNTFTKQRNRTKGHWLTIKVMTRTQLNQVLLIMANKIIAFGLWLVGIPKMFYDRIVQGANWLARAGALLVKRLVKGVKDKVKDLLGAGKQAGKKTTKGYDKGAKGAKKSGKKAGEQTRKGFKRGTRKGAKDGEKAGKQVGKGFKKGAKKGQKKGGIQVAREFINGLKKKLGISSPSKAAEKLGEAVSVGFTGGVGWEDLKDVSAKNMGKVTKAMQNKLITFGKWMKGLPKHWKNLFLLNAHYMSEAGRGLAKALIGAVQERLGIKSPSKEFERIGRFMIMGLIRGMSKDDLFGFMVKKYGGIEKFMEGLMGLFEANLGMGFPALDEFFGVNVEELLKKLREKFGVQIGGGEAGALAGMPLEVGNTDMMRRIADWLIAQDPDSKSSITSLFRKGDPRDHGKGRAVDIAPGSDKIANLAANIIGYKGNWGENSKGAFGLLGTDFGQVLWKTMIGGNHWNHVHLGIKGISGFLKSLTVAAPGGGEGGDVWSQVRAAFVKIWPDPQQMLDLHSLLMKESGMEPGIPNKEGSGAWGLFQLMPMHHGKGKHLPKGTASNLQEEIAGGISYIRAAHGSPSQAWKFWQNPTRGKPEWGNWYKGGGEVSATLHTGERVLTARQNRWFTDLAGPLSGVVQGTGKMYNNTKVQVNIPDGTKFKIVDLHEGIVEAVGEGFDLYDEDQAKDLRKYYRGKK